MKCNLMIIQLKLVRWKYKDKGIKTLMMIAQLLQYSAVPTANTMYGARGTMNGSISSITMNVPLDEAKVVKKKLEKHIRGCLVVRNPVPDNLVKLDDPTGEQNKYFNQQTQEAVIFPRLGAFQIYAYDLLIFSKLELNQWPNHFKIIEIVQNMIEDIKNGKDISKYALIPQDQSINIVNNDQVNDGLRLKLPNAITQRTFIHDIQQKYANGPTQGGTSARVPQKKDLKLPPANKIYKKIYKSRNDEYQQEKQRDKKKKTKIPQKGKISKDPRNALEGYMFTKTPLRSEQSNLTQNRSNIPSQSIGSSKIRNLDKEYTYYQPSTEKQAVQKMNKTVDFQQTRTKEAPNRYRNNDQALISQTSHVSSNSSKNAILQQGQNVYKQFTQQFHPIRIKSFQKGSFISQGSNNPGRKAIYRKKNLQIVPLYDQIINKPKQKIIAKQQVNIELKSGAQRKKRWLVQPQIEYSVNKQIVDYFTNRQFNITRPIQYEINKQIVEQQAKITYHDGGMQVTERQVSQYSQQMSLQEIPQQYMKQFNDAQIQGDFTNEIMPGDRVIYMKRDVSVQLSEYFGGQVQDVAIQMQAVRQNLGINTELIEKVTLDIGINTQQQFIGVQQSSIKQNQVEIPIAPKQTKKDDTFVPLGQRKKNIPDNQFYSIDRYQNVITKYHWIGRANFLQDQMTTRKCFFKEKTLFQLYKMLDIRCANKILSYQHYSNNNNGEQYQQQIYLHVMTQQIPEIKFFNQFQEYHYSQNMFPNMDFVSLRQSRNLVSIKKYGRLLAASRFFNDLELFSQSHYHLGFQMKNYSIQQFIKLLSINYNPEQKAYQSYQRKIPMSRQNKFIYFDKLSEPIKLDFIGTLHYIYYELNLQKLKQAILKLQQQPGDFQKYFQRTLDNFIKWLQERKQLLKKQYENQFQMYKRYGCFQPKIDKFWKNSIYIPMDVVIITSHKQQDKLNRMPLLQCVNNFLESSALPKKKVLLIKGVSGIGKSSSLRFLKTYYQSQKKLNKLVFIDLEYIQGLNDVKLLQKNLLEAPVVFVDNFQGNNSFSEIFKILFGINGKDGKDKKLIITCDTSNFVEETVNTYFVAAGIQQLQQCELLGFDDMQILSFVNKYLESKGFKKGQQLNSRVQKTRLDLFKVDQIRKNISNPGQLLYVLYFLEDLLKKKQKINIYKLLKRVNDSCINFHKQFCSASKLPYKNVQNTLKVFALKAFKQNKLQLSLTEFPDLQEFQTDRYLDSYIQFYPIQLVSSLNKYSLYHSSFLYYYVSCAICEIVQRGFKGINLVDITKNRQVIQLIRQRYVGRGGENRLIDIITQSKMNMNLGQQASNAITLLAKIGYVFSDLNFEGIQIPNADLSFGVFYNTSFKLANIDGVNLFNTNIINSTFDGASVGGVDFGIRKYSIQAQVCCGALSLDGKLIAMGSQNNVLLFYCDTGKLAKTLVGHTQVVRNVFFSRDQVSVISISDDKSIKIWNIESGANITLRVPSKVGIVFNFEAQKICCASKDIVRVWSMKLLGGQIVLKGHSATVLNVCFNTQGNLIATASSDKTAKIWNISGQNLKTFSGHQDQVILVSISPNNQVLASAGLDNTLRLWDIGKGTQKYVFTFQQKISCMCFTPQQKYLVIAQQKDFLIKVVNIKTYQQAFKFEGHDDEIIKLQFDKYGKKLISVSLDKSVRVWNFTKFRQSQFIQGHTEQVWSVNFHKNNLYAASGAADKTVKIWDIRQGTQLRTLIGHEKEVFCVCFSPIGTRIASGGQDNTIRIWDIITGEQVLCLNHHEDWVYSVNFTNDGYLLASSDASGKIIIWDVYKEKILASLKGHVGEVYSTCFNKNNQLIASGGSDKIIKIWNIPNKQQTKALKAHQDNIWSVKFFRSQQLLSGSKDGTLILWNYINGQVIKRINCHSSVQCINVINQQKIAFSLQDGKIKIIDIINDRQLKIFRSTDSVWNIDLSNDLTKLISGGADNTVRIYNLSCFMQNRQKFYLKFGSLVYSKSGQKSAKLLNSKTIIITDLIKRKQQTILFSNQESIQSISFSFNNNIVLMKEGDVYTEYIFESKKQIQISNINEYNKDSSQELLFCKGKFPRKFEKCSFKKLRNATQQIMDIFEE